MKLVMLVLGFLLTSGFVNAQDTMPSAETILNDAYKQASDQNKNIIVIFHASWCGWCRKMNDAMNDGSCKKSFESSYVIVYLVVEESKENKDFENPGAALYKKKWLGEKASLPFWVVLDKEGKVLADSYIRKPGISKDQPAVNIGCPTSDEEIEAFKNILRKTSSLSDSKIEMIGKRFKKNKQRL